MIDQFPAVFVIRLRDAIEPSRFASGWPEPAEALSVSATRFHDEDVRTGRFVF